MRSRPPPARAGVARPAAADLPRARLDLRPFAALVDFAFFLVDAMRCFSRSHLDDELRGGTRYILMRAPGSLMPLFDGPIQFLGCDCRCDRGSLESMSTLAAPRDRGAW